MSPGTGEEDELPAQLLKAFEGDKALLRWTMELSAWMRREIMVLILEPKSEAARVRRAEHMAERLLATMEAERELPPMIAMPLRRTPGAMKGWEAMTPMQRRLGLLAIFRPLGMEGRERQIRKVVDACVERERKEKG